MNYVVLPHYAQIENKKVKTYGIVVVNRFIPVKVLKDVSTDYKTVRKLVKRLNKGRIELVHLDDIIEDFFFDNL